MLTRNISSKSMHAFLSNLANRQTDRQTNKQTNKHGQIHVPPLLSEVITSICPAVTKTRSTLATGENTPRVAGFGDLIARFVHVL